jgi:hypothetical protein
MQHPESGSSYGQGVTVLHILTSPLGNTPNKVTVVDSSTQEFQPGFTGLPTPISCLDMPTAIDPLLEGSHRF